MTGPHCHLVVMGVSGTGKSTVARGLASTFGLALAEADDFHPLANIEKMRAGTPLDDDDRRPWLEALADWTRARHDEDAATVVTCSALRRSYRDVLRSAVPDEPTLFMHLVAGREVLRERMERREGHFMSASLLDSQLATLEPLDAEEDGVVVDNDGSAEDTLRAAVAWVEDQLRRG